MTVSLARRTLIHEWRRFLPAILAVGFATLLQLLQAALVLGIFGGAAVYVSRSDADIWMGYPGTQSVDQGRSIDPDLDALLNMNPAVRQVEPFVLLDGDWHGRHGTGGVSVYISGIGTRPDAMMFSQVLPAALRTKLAEPEAVVVDPADLEKLGTAVGGTASINGHLVRVVGTTHGLRALGGVNVLTSLQTAHMLDSDSSDGARPTYLVARLRAGSSASQVVRQLRGHSGFGPYQVWTAASFARRSVLFWLFDTGAGAGVLFLAGIVLLVGVIITSQALMAAVVASINEYATLNALGVGKGALRWVVLEQAFWVGSCGLVGAAILSALLIWTARAQSVPVIMNATVMLICLGVVMVLVALSGLAAMRSMRRADPAALLR